MKQISVLVVDDSAFMRKMVSQSLGKAEDIVVVGQARDGNDALEKIARLNPDVVTLDVEMPVMDGVATLREIVKHHESRVVMLSSLTQAGARTTLQCLEIGAVDFISKPSGAISLDIEKITDELLAKVRAAATASKPSRFDTPIVRAPLGRMPRRASVVVIGSSTGGPRALQAIVPALPKDIGVPLVIVQHMPPEFTATLATRLDSYSQISVREARNGDTLQKGTALVAAGGYHLEFDVSGRVSLTDTPPIHGVRPSIDVTISSLLRTHGNRMLGVLLTGMGADGALGLKAIRQAGGVTIAEHESTCVVYGMPKAALEMGGVSRMRPLGDIASEIMAALTSDPAASRVA